MMLHIRCAGQEDKDRWFSFDRHMDQKLFERKAAFGECYIMEYDNRCVGVMRYNLFWDAIPFLNFIYIHEAFRKKGIGKRTVTFWENEMKKLGYKVVMTSTMVEEEAQHFYRKLGYKDCGCLVKDIPALQETMEMFMIKQL